MLNLPAQHSKSLHTTCQSHLSQTAVHKACSSHGTVQAVFLLSSHHDVCICRADGNICHHLWCIAARCTWHIAGRCRPLAASVPCLQQHTWLVPSPNGHATAAKQAGFPDIQLFSGAPQATALPQKLAKTNSQPHPARQLSCHESRFDFTSTLHRQQQQATYLDSTHEWTWLQPASQPSQPASQPEKAICYQRWVGTRRTRPPHVRPTLDGHPAGHRTTWQLCRPRPALIHPFKPLSLAWTSRPAPPLHLPYPPQPPQTPWGHSEHA